MDSDNTEPEIPDEANRIIESERAGDLRKAVDLGDVLREMGEFYRLDPMKAVRGQGFIKYLHRYVGSQLDARLTKFAIRRNITVEYEAQILGSTKPKDVDIAVIDPDNGPLVLVGVRSQMSSIGKNVLTYYEGIVGECMSLQERFPMCTHGYVYLHPLTSIKEGKERESIDHARYAKMYAAITGRSGPDYKNQRGIFDQFAYMVADFEKTPPELRDDIVRTSVANIDMSIDTFVERIIATLNARMLFWDIFQ